MPSLIGRLLAAGLVLASLVPARADQPVQLVVHWRGVPDPGLTTLIAEVGAPASVSVARGQRPYDVILGLCGANLAYIALAQKADPALDVFAPLPEARDLSLPACIGPGDPARVEARPGDTMGSLASEVGVPFRPYTTDWSDLPGIPVAHEGARLADVERRINLLARDPAWSEVMLTSSGLSVVDRTPITPYVLQTPGPSSFPTFQDNLDGNEIIFPFVPGVTEQSIDLGQGNPTLHRDGAGQPYPLLWSTGIVNTRRDDAWLFPTGPMIQAASAETTISAAMASHEMAPIFERTMAAQIETASGNDLADASVDIASLLTQRLQTRVDQLDPSLNASAGLGTWRKAQTSFAGLFNNAEIRVGNGLDASFPVAPGQEYVLPDLTPRWQTIPLKPGLSGADYDSAYRRVAAADAVTAQALSDAGIEIVAAPRHFHNIGNNECGPDSGLPPFDAAAVMRQLGLNEKLRLERGLPSLADSSGIMVLDNGFPEIAAQQLARIWPEDDKIFLALPRTGSHSAMSTSQFVPPSPVVNVATASLATEVPANYPEVAGTNPSGRWHGLAVTMTAFGGVDFEPYRLMMRKPIRIGFAGMIDPRGLLATSVNEAVKLAMNAQVRVINASFSFPGKPGNLDDAIASLDSRAILVVAAGNDGANLDDISIYPPKFGGRSVEAKGKTVITVGMSRHDGTLHPKSNWSPTYVDLLAPGCDIRSYAIEGEGDDRRLVQARWTGTSFSAPLVTFTASLLARNMREAPVIKARLINSVDFAPPLDAQGNPAPTSVASGVLDVEQALAFPFNQFILADGRRLLDTDSNADRPPVRLCGNDFAFGRVARLSIRDGRAYFRNQSDTPADGQILELRSCSLAVGDQLEFEVTDYATGLPARIALGDLTDFIALEPGVTP